MISSKRLLLIVVTMVRALQNLEQSVHVTLHLLARTVSSVLLVTNLKITHQPILRDVRRL